MACCLCFPSLCAAVFIPFLSSNFLLCLLVTSFLLAVSCVWCVFFLLFLSISYSIPFSDPLFLATLNPLGDQDHYCKSKKLPFLYFEKRQPTHTLPVSHSWSTDVLHLPGSKRYFWRAGGSTWSLNGYTSWKPLSFEGWTKLRVSLWVIHGPSPSHSTQVSFLVGHWKKKWEGMCHRQLPITVLLIIERNYCNTFVLEHFKLSSVYIMYFYSPQRQVPFQKIFDSNFSLFEVNSSLYFIFLFSFHLNFLLPLLHNWIT